MSETLRVLMVEDSESDAALITRRLGKSGYILDLERVEDAGSMRQALARQEWDLIISDYQLPQFDAAEALRIRNESNHEVPFIVVSGTIGEDRAVEMMRAGAQDYVLKDRIARLVPAVQREIQKAKSVREHRKVEDQLRDRDEWLALAVSVTQLGTFDFYPQSGRLVLSKSGCSHIGMPSDCDISAEALISCVHPDDRERLHGLLRMALDPANGGEVMADFRVIGCTDHVERWLAAQGRVFFDPEGNPVRFVGVTIDITQRKQVEGRLTILDGAKNDFLQLISHEFRTPLNGLLGIGELILEEMPASGGNTKLRESFKRCRKRILSILDDALLLSEIGVGGQEFECCGVSLHAALNRSIEDAAEFAAARGVTLEPPPAIPNLVWANEELLVRALQALLETSIKFSAKGETIKQFHTPNNHSVGLSIESTGLTIPDESLAKFFDILAIGEAITPGGDLGLGAAVARRILLLFGASVTVANRDSSGIRLTISLQGY